VGPGSLLQRIDTTHSIWGERTLVGWLLGPAPGASIVPRQNAVRELSSRPEFRQELEAVALEGQADRKLSGERFFDLVATTPFVVGWRRIAAMALPSLTVALIAALAFGLVRGAVWWLLIAPQAVLVAATWKTAVDRLELFDARRPHLEAFGKMLALIESTAFDSPLLLDLRRCLDVEGRPPSHHMRVLAWWAGWADLRFQPLLHPVVNILFMWDWQILWAVERWNASAGARARRWLETVGEIEALASLSVLHALDSTCFPEIVPDDEGFAATDLGHPLILRDSRVGNDLALQGPKCVLVVTGSNMAGKSTLLRAVGINVVLALAGAPVCAHALRVPLVRLRSSMRVSDSLQSGASYFYAELAKLKAVVRDASVAPPILFLFDELLRGTNAEARKTGAMAVVLHLLSQNAMGLVATHDDSVCALASMPGVCADNMHMTDVVVNDEMVFDYRLRPGRAVTSNALRLLAGAGIPLPKSLQREATESPKK
jgi:DNA mismatch repair ATPase MutS